MFTVMLDYSLTHEIKVEFILILNVAFLCVCSTEILRDVSFTVEAGQTVALVCSPLLTVLYRL